MRSGLWKNRRFVLLFAAQLVSLIGSGATTIGLALFAYRLAGAGSATVVVGNALMLRILAFLVFSQPAGVLADRVSRKRILIASDLLRAALLLVLPFVTAVWQIYVVIFAINGLTAFFTPTYEASVPAVVGEDEIVAALSVSRVAIDVESIAAPAVAAVIVAAVGVDWVFWFDGLTYLVAALLIAFVELPKVEMPASVLSVRALLRDVTHGANVILREASLRQALLLSLAEASAGAAAIVGTVAYVRNVLGLGETEVSIAMGALGVGSSVTALVLGRLTGRYERRARDRAALHGARHVWAQRALVVGGVCLGVALLPTLLAPPLVILLVLWSILGAGQALIAIPSSTLLAEHTSPEERGRAYPAHFALTHAFWLVSYPVIGHSAARWGAPWTFAGAAAVCIVVTVLARVSQTPGNAHLHAD